MKMVKFSFYKINFEFISVLRPGLNGALFAGTSFPRHSEQTGKKAGVEDRLRRPNNN